MSVLNNLGYEYKQAKQRLAIPGIQKSGWGKIGDLFGRWENPNLGGGRAKDFIRKISHISAHFPIFNIFNFFQAREKKEKKQS